MDKTKEMMLQVISEWPAVEQEKFVQEARRRIPGSPKKQGLLPCTSSVKSWPHERPQHILRPADYAWVGCLFNQSGVRHIMRLLHVLGFGPLSLADIQHALFERGIPLGLGQITQVLRRSRAGTIVDDRVVIVRMVPINSVEFLLRMSYNRSADRKELYDTWARMNPELRPRWASVLAALRSRPESSERDPVVRLLTGGD